MTPSAPLLLVSLFLALLLSPASSQTPPEDLISRNADFGARLYRAVAARTDENVLLCPFTLSAALTLMLTAADGSTLEQLKGGLTLTGLDPQTLPGRFRCQGSSVSTLQQGAAVFHDQSVRVSQSYLNLVQTKFGGTVRGVAYTTASEAVHTINRWALEQTGDQVQSFVSELDPQTQLLLAAATSYRGTYHLPPFNTSSTQDERFYVDSYHVVMVPMMFRADKYFLAYDASVKAGVLKLPMTDRTAMLAVLPDEGVDVTAVEEEVTAEKIQAWIRQLKKTKLEVQFPRFWLERSYSLKDALKTLDITQVFQDNADLSNMSGSKGFKLTQVSVQRVSLDVNASGFSSLLFSSPPPRLTFNRPFIFIIYHQSTGSLLLMGRVNDPTRK
uniref:Serpin peptidase inhibitor, clade A (alpha-1 antiproteinase, antitrypsin), member 10a n=1 Tax=Amphilophus citrinellus TaxID=61819 RepID=A0A3Q0TA20_AMPCI